MPAQIRTPRSGWIDEGLRALGAGGPDAVRIEALAQALGVTKGGFYWHFDDRQALLTEMLDTWERVVSDDVIARVDSMGGDARTRLRHLFGIAVSLDGIVAIELAIREWSRRDVLVARRMQRLDNRRMEYMRSLFGELTSDAADVEARCYLAFSLFLASDYIHADHPNHTRAEVVEQAAEWLLS